LADIQWNQRNKEHLSMLNLTGQDKVLGQIISTLSRMGSFYIKDTTNSLSKKINQEICFDSISDSTL